MFDWFNTDVSKSNTNAIDLLKADHDNVKELFSQFEKSENAQARKKGSEQEFDKKAISRGFPEHDEFGFGDGHTLSLEEQVA